MDKEIVLSNRSEQFPNSESILPRRLARQWQSWLGLGRQQVRILTTANRKVCEHAMFCGLLLPSCSAEGMETFLCGQLACSSVLLTLLQATHITRMSVVLQAPPTCRSYAIIGRSVSQSVHFPGTWRNVVGQVSSGATVTDVRSLEFRSMLVPGELREKAFQYARKSVSQILRNSSLMITFLAPFDSL
jgi:hypothetical protein